VRFAVAAGDAHVRVDLPDGIADSRLCGEETGDSSESDEASAEAAALEHLTAGRVFVFLCHYLVFRNSLGRQGQGQATCLECLAAAAEAVVYAYSLTLEAVPLRGQQADGGAQHAQSGKTHGAEEEIATIVKICGYVHYPAFFFVKILITFLIVSST